VVDYERPVDDPECPLGRNDKEWMKHTLWFKDGNRLGLQAGEAEAADGGYCAAQAAYLLRLFLLPFR
jgi:hypothetical protein